MADLQKIPIAKHPKKDMVMGPMMDGKDGIPYYYPSFSVNDKQMPEVDEWEPEGRYRFVIDVVMTSKDSQRHMPTRGGFDIVGYKVLPPPKGVMEMDDKEFGEYQGKVLEKASKK